MIVAFDDLPKGIKSYVASCVESYAAFTYAFVLSCPALSL